MVLDSLFPIRRYPGKFNQKIHDDKMARGIRVFGAPLSPEVRVEMYGSYEKGAILKNCWFRIRPGSKVFHFIRKILTDDERKIMRDTPNVTLRPGVKAFSTSPYDCEFDQMKLYQDPTTKQVHRCIIEDVYCVQQTITNLALNADILLIDIGEQRKSVQNKYLYDLPQRINYLAETDWEAKLAKLNLEEYLDDDDEIFEDFKKCVSSSKPKLYDIKICGYGDDSVYRIDLITTNQESFLERHGLVFKSKSNSKRSKDESIDEKAFYEVLRMLPGPDQRRYKLGHKSISTQPPPRRYSCAVEYFRRRLAEQNLRLDEPRNKRKLLLVVPTEWQGVDQITILPHDDDYRDSHKDFVKAIGSLECMKNVSEEGSIPIRLYKPGQFVIFKNAFRDSEVNPWLRGVVTSMSCYTDHRLLLKQRNTIAERQKNYYSIKRLVDSGEVRADDLIYRVRSVDYGLECRCSPITMRLVDNLNEFRRIGTWTLTCRLFGVHPDENCPTRETYRLFNNWMNQKRTSPRPPLEPFVLDVIFRDNLLSYKPDRDFDKRYEISLFHREDRVYLKNHLCLGRDRYSNFECVNWYLVERGHATQHSRNGNSNIQLEDHVMKLMVKHKKL